MDEFEVEVVAALASTDAGGEALVRLASYTITAELPAVAERVAVERYADEVRAGERLPQHLLLFAQTVAMFALPFAA